MRAPALLGLLLLVPALLAGCVDAEEPVPRHAYKNVDCQIGIMVSSPTLYGELAPAASREGFVLTEFAPESGHPGAHPGLAARWGAYVYESLEWMPPAAEGRVFDRAGNFSLGLGARAALHAAYRADVAEEVVLQDFRRVLRSAFVVDEARLADLERRWMQTTPMGIGGEPGAWHSIDVDLPLRLDALVEEATAGVPPEALKTLGDGVGVLEFTAGEWRFRVASPLRQVLARDDAMLLALRVDPEGDGELTFGGARTPTRAEALAALEDARERLGLGPIHAEEGHYSAGKAACGPVDSGAPTSAA